MALFPLAVRLASTFLQKSDLQYVNTSIRIEMIFFPFRSSHVHLNSKSNIEMSSILKDEPSVLKKTTDEADDLYDTSSSDNLLSQFEHTFSSSSDFNLSNALQNSSLSLAALDHEDAPTIDDENLPGTSSDDESMLYHRLSDELNIVQATLESDLEQLGR